MNVAMSCAGEGFGHVSRMISFAQSLRDQYQLVLFAPKSVQHHIRRSIPDAVVVTIPYFNMVKRGDRIRYRATVLQNVNRAIAFRADVRMIRRRLAALKVRAVVTDYEPYLPAAARALDVPVMQVNHPGIVLRHPGMSVDSFVARIVARMMMGRSDRKMFVSFYNGDIGPILKDELAQQTTSRGSYYVVYAKPTYRRKVIMELEKLGIVDYMVFPDPRRDYVTALAGCRGLITGGGHQSLSEAVTLGKPVFSIPQRGQYEQQLNARMLVASGWGMKGRFSNLDTTLSRFIANIDRFPLHGRNTSVFFDAAGTRFRFVNDRETAVAAIDTFIREYAGSGTVRRLIMNVQYEINRTLQAIGLAG
ncbi:MAG: glycosyltransferase family protein [Spirochaetia bacterium]